MDLTKLYNLTTPELRAEAERLGVSDTYALSRAQLIHTIRNRVGGPPPEGLLGRVLGFAKWALQTTAAVPAEPSEDAAEEDPSDAPESAPAARPLFIPSSPPGSVSGSVPVSVPASVSGSVPASAPAGVFSGARPTFEEPFPTRTMARILADQGHYKRSLAIYANLLRDTPDDPELRGEADAVRSQSRARRPHVQ
jgi:hypothetical protein